MLQYYTTAARHALACTRAVYTYVYVKGYVCVYSATVTLYSRSLSRARVARIRSACILRARATLYYTILTRAPGLKMAKASQRERASAKEKKHTHTRTHAHLLRPELFRCDCCWTAAVLSDVAIHTCSMHITMTMIVVNGNT